MKLRSEVNLLSEGSEVKLRSEVNLRSEVGYPNRTLKLTAIDGQMSNCAPFGRGYVLTYDLYT